MRSCCAPLCVAAPFSTRAPAAHHTRPRTQAKQEVRKAWGRTPADQFAEEVCAYDEYGPAIESLEECHRWRYGDSWSQWLIVGCMCAILLVFVALAMREWCLNRAQKRGMTEASSLLAAK